MRTTRFSTRSAVVAILFVACVVACASVMSGFAIAAASTADTHFASPFGNAASPDNHTERARATAGFHPAYQLVDTSNERPKGGAASAWPSPASITNRAREVLELPKAGKVLARCRTLGMVELPEQAFELSESGGESGSGYLVVPMTNPGGDRFASSMLYREEDGSVIAITVDTATDELMEVVSADDGSGSEAQAIRFNKKKWTECFVAACGPCIAGCAYTGPLWLKCSGACCGVAAAICVYFAMRE